MLLDMKLFMSIPEQLMLLGVWSGEHSLPHCLDYKLNFSIA